MTIGVNSGAVDAMAVALAMAFATSTGVDGAGAAVVVVVVAVVVVVGGTKLPLLSITTIFFEDGRG